MSALRKEAPCTVKVRGKSRRGTAMLGINLACAHPPERCRCHQLAFHPDNPKSSSIGLDLRTAGPIVVEGGTSSSSATSRRSGRS